MAPDEADSPARRIYFALQAAYIGNDAERLHGLSAARSLIDDFKTATTSAVARDILDQAWTAAEADNCYKALKLIGRVIQHEDAALGRFPNATATNPIGTKTAWNGPIPSLRSNQRHENHDSCHTSL